MITSSETVDGPNIAGTTVSEKQKPSEPPKVDEVKRLEKVYDLSKEMFGYTENIIKALDEKSRNSVSVASALAAFAFLIRKPADLSAVPPLTLGIIGLLALLVGMVYVLHVVIVRPQLSKAVDPADLLDMEQTTIVPEEVLFYNFFALTGIYKFNLTTIDNKSKLIRIQNFALGFTLLASLLYIVLAGGTASSVQPRVQAPVILASPVSAASVHPSLAQPTPSVKP